jgi:tRNA (guanosine-2'-O-)-methyltransferase
MLTPNRLEKYQFSIMNRQPDLTLVCENISDSHNVSAIFRTCDSVGIPNVDLLYNIEPFPEIGHKTSGTASKWVNSRKYTDYDKIQHDLKSSGFTIYATHLTETSTPFYDIDWTKPSAIIMGNEHRGVSDEALKIADEIICIPMFGMVQSLNVSVASAIILYEALRQRLKNENYPNPHLSDMWQNNMLDNWTIKQRRK